MLAALSRRQRTGEGAHAKIALSDVALAAMSNLGLLAEYATTGAVRPRSGNDIYGAFGRDFATADRERVMIVAITGRQWRALVKALAMEAPIRELEQALGADLADEGQRYAHREKLAELMAPWFRQRTLAEIESRLAEAGAAWSPYRSLDRALAHLTSGADPTRILETIEQPDVGRVPSAGIPVVFASDPRKPSRGAPRPSRRPGLPGSSGRVRPMPSE